MTCARRACHPYRCATPRAYAFPSYPALRCAVRATGGGLSAVFAAKRVAVEAAAAVVSFQPSTHAPVALQEQGEPSSKH